MFYSSEIFKQIDFSPRIGSGLVGFINMAATFGAVFLLGSKYLFHNFNRIREKDNPVGSKFHDGSRLDRPWYFLFLFK